MPTKISRLRADAYQRQSGRCYYCCSPMWQKNPASFALKYRISVAQAERFQCTAEHLQALQDGGPTSHQNIVAACRYCNQTRHRRKVAASPSAFRVHVTNRLLRRRWHPHWVFERGMHQRKQAESV